jgi:hypothetical protein
MRFIILTGLLILSFQVSLGQEKPKAELFDEFGMIDCCHSNFDNFLNEISETNSIGYIVIYKNKDKPLESYYYEVALKSHFLVRDVKNIIFIQGKSENSTRTELWKIPQGAEKPSFDEEKWNYYFQSKTKPFIFYSDSEVDGICMFFSNLYFQNILNGNIDANLNVVIYANSQKQFLQKRKKMQKNLVKNYDVKQNRLKFFRKPKTNNVLANAEYWLVPKNQRN